MNKKVKWGLVAFIACGLIGWGIYSQLPKLNADLEQAEDAKKEVGEKKNVLNVNAQVIKTGKLTDEIMVTGNLLPDEEVDLSFETSGQVVEINFKEGSHVRQGQLLAKVNDRKLQAELKRLESQGFVIRQTVERDARLKRVTTTPKADALYQDIMERISSVESLLTRGLSQAEVEQFLNTVEKLKQNLM